MDEEKRKKLETNGWKIVTVAEFLDLSPEEERLVEEKLAQSKQAKEVDLNKQSDSA